MLFVPYERFELPSPLGPSQIAAHLEPLVEAKQRWFARPSPRTSFYGRVSLREFSLTRATRGLNTYAPWVRGLVSPSPAGGSAVSVVVTIHPIAIAILLAFFGFMLALGARVALVLTCFVVFHCLMYFWAFLPEYRAVRELLRQALAAG